MLADPVLVPDSTIILGPALFVANYKGIIEPNNRLLAVDRQGRPIPHTYLGNMERVCWEASPGWSKRTLSLDEGFLFYATPWHANFQHFLTETFPKIVDYLEWVRLHGRAIPLLVPRFMINGFVQEVFRVHGLEARLTVLEEGRMYRVKALYSSSYVPNYDPPTEKMIAAFRLLRDSAQKAYPVTPPPRSRRIYLARDKFSNHAQNNSNAGAKRVITNENAVQGMLYGRGFEDVLMGSLRIGEKMQALAGAEIIVSPIGANLMNLLFLIPPYPRKVVILHSSYLAVHAIYFRDILEAVYDGRITVGFFEGPGEAQTENSPYELPAGEFEHFLRCMVNAWGPRMFPTFQPGVCA
jgi:capsular polysaccharide biosynthesis protein